MSKSFKDKKKQYQDFDSFDRRGAKKQIRSDMHRVHGNNGNLTKNVFRALEADNDEDFDPDYL